MTQTTDYTFPSRPTLFVLGELKSKSAQMNACRTAVESMGVVTISPEPRQDGGTFHARLLVTLKDGTMISLDPSPGSEFTAAGEPKGVIIITMEPHPSDKDEKFGNSPNPTTFQHSVAHNDVLFAHICQALFDDGHFDSYYFTPQGTGCRYWCAQAIGHLEAEEILESGTGKEFEDWEKEQHAAYGERFPVPPAQGRFFKVGT